MTYKQFKALVHKYKGWIEGGKAYFPSPALKDQFLKEYEGV